MILLKQDTSTGSYTDAFNLLHFNNPIAIGFNCSWYIIRQYNK